MLRMSFMPSDFHPIVLILGSRVELMAVADILKTFAKDGVSKSLREENIFSTDTEVFLVEHKDQDGRKPGAWLVDKDTYKVEWRLTKDDALHFSKEVEEFSNSEELANSLTLECEVLDEVRVKVSFGEWEDHYLTNDLR